MSASYSNSNAPNLPDKSRRKNCNACVWSKRRCDKRTPRCTRCAEKNFSCVYQSLPSSSAAASAAAAGTAARTGDHLQHAVDLEGGGVPTPDPFDFNNLESHPVSTSGAHTDSTSVMNELADTNCTATSPSIGLNLDANMLFDFNSVLIADSVQGGNMQLWEMQQASVVSKTLVPELPRMGSECCQRDEILVSNLTLSILSYSSCTPGIKNATQDPFLSQNHLVLVDYPLHLFLSLQEILRPKWCTLVVQRLSAPCHREVSNPGTSTSPTPASASSYLTSQIYTPRSPRQRRRPSSIATSIAAFPPRRGPS